MGVKFPRLARYSAEDEYCDYGGACSEFRSDNTGYGDPAQRYVIHELAQTVNFKPLTNRYTATAFALVLAAAVALLQGPSGPGSGGLTLWPLFGATNQLLAGLAFMVIVFYLLRRDKPIWFAFLPHGRYVDHACVGNAPSNVQSGDGVAFYRSISTFRVRCCR